MLTQAAKHNFRGGGTGTCSIYFCLLHRAFLGASPFLLSAFGLFLYTKLALEVY